MNILLLFACWSLAFPMSETFLRMKPDRRFMSFALHRYLSWHEHHFPSRYGRISGTEKVFVNTLIASVDHWVVPGYASYPQFSIGHEVRNKSLFQTWRIFIPQDLRRDSFITKQGVGGEPWFYEWDDAGLRCFFFRDEGERISFTRKCQGPKDTNFVVSGNEILSHEISPWPNPFPLLSSYEIRVTENGKLTRIRYASRSTHPSGIPPELLPVVNLHGLEALFPLDKFAVDASGNLTVYYP